MKEKHKKERIIYIDIMRCSAIILVVVGHINKYNAFIKSYIYSYHKPLFFFIYGIVISATDLKRKV